MFTSPPSFLTCPDSYVNDPTLISIAIATLIGITSVSKANSSITNSVLGASVTLVPSLNNIFIAPSSPVCKKSAICNS